jgi:hypothetical protein
MTSSKPEGEPDVSGIGSRRDIHNISRLVVLVAIGDEDRCRQIAQSVRELGARDVIETHSLGAALEQLGRQSPDLLLCGEHLRDHHGTLLVDAARRVSPATIAHLLPMFADDDRPDGSASDFFEPSNRTAARELLTNILHAAVAPRGGFWCRVPELSLSDILQMYHQLRRSVTVLVSGRIGGRIRLEDGELVYAECDDRLGEAALCRLLATEAGLVRTDGSEFEGPVNISGPFHRVLFEAMDQLHILRQTASAESLRGLDESAFDEPTLWEPPPPPEPQLASSGAPSLHEGRVWPATRKLWLMVGVGTATALALHFLVTEWPDGTDASERSPVLAVSVESSRAAEVEKPAPPAASAQPSPSTTHPGVSRFALGITSSPSGASVLEGDRIIGTTPLTISCERSSLERGPRTFVLVAKGYLPHTLQQTMAEADVNVHAVLVPNPPLASVSAPTPVKAPPATASASSPAKAAGAPDAELEIRLQR